ncbi:aspartate ammonia-lyase [Bradyrhizobium canariense]|uniref:Aspartate ammonia-lyase n=1 Tax=Bradyrhizobium canariense TaxID=255045 RepID=A0A1H1YQ85_9BRAD|nr:aspartate ammonia-lyase [Bradyrhizobium canariense]SDT23429.1 aspartate ammonia-lyase [Bradyrhizobium canariense]
MSIVRVEHDSLGQIIVPEGVYWGAQTARAVQNFQISGYYFSQYPCLIRGLAMVKQAAATANFEIGRLSETKCHAIVRACECVRAGMLDDQFPTDMMQGGAGTSANMNMNEVIANRGLEFIGIAKGRYDQLHPNDDVNLSQSTNDVFPTAIRIAIAAESIFLGETLKNLAEAFNLKGQDHLTIMKLGRTQLQDAVPMRLGDELAAFGTVLRSEIDRLKEARVLMHEVNLGGTAIGTGINAGSKFSSMALQTLSRISGIDLHQSSDLIAASWDVGAFVSFSGVLKQIAVKLSKIASDLRLLASGPQGGIGEIRLPPRQPGSSIMPGKINPVIAEMVNQVCFQVIANDLAVGMAAQAGQLQLNAFEPLIAYNIFNSLKMLTNAIKTFTELCVEGIQAQPDVCRQNLNKSAGSATALVPLLGYEIAAEIATRALASGESVRELAIQAGLSEDEVNQLLDLDSLVAGGVEQCAE